MAAIARSALDRTWTVEGVASARTLLSGSSPNLLVTDVLLALLMTIAALVSVMLARAPAEFPSAVLPCVAALCLAARRISPMTVLVICAGCLCLYESLGHPHPQPALPVAVLIALYTVASGSRAPISAVASGALLASAFGSSIIRAGWPLDNFDDQLFAYALSVGAATALGYAVQLSRARTQLMEEQAELLATRHAAHEQQALQQEQARIARELHDVVAHQVSVITALAAGAERIFDTEPETARQALNSIEIAGREAMTEMRRLLRIVRSAIDDVGLVPQPCLEQLPGLVAQTERAGLRVQLSVSGEARSLPAGLEVCAYRIVQEALTNTLKHAGPSRADVLVHYQAESLELQICDDGLGMAGNCHPGQGLIGMRERAALVGGWLMVGAGPSGGVQVRARLPVEPVQQ
jgi:signal transduction histidine kinase